MGQKKQLLNSDGRRQTIDIGKLKSNIQLIKIIDYLSNGLYAVKELKVLGLANLVYSRFGIRKSILSH